jgi:hypothetical protein
VGRARLTKNLTKSRHKKAFTFAGIEEKYLTPASETEAERTRKNKVWKDVPRFKP